jgi:hypothetical protein
MAVSSSVVLLLAVVATCLAVLRLVEIRDTLHGQGSLKLTDQGSHSVLAFATHYFFSVFVLCTTCMTTEPSALLDGVGGQWEKATRLCCFGGVAVLTILFFI